LQASRTQSRQSVSRCSACCRSLGCNLEADSACHKTKVNGHWSGFAPRFWKKIFVAIHCAEVMTAPAAMPCKGHGGIEGVAIAVALTTAKVVAGLGTSGGVVALVQEEEVVTPTMTTVNHA
ncbi:hypothetical protein CLOP_g12048, partial [Closterium sp. NIES-67]